MNYLNQEDEHLISIAKELINRNNVFGELYCTVASVVKCRTGNIYKGINIRSNHGYCAESIALGAALTAGDKEIETIVAISYEGQVLSPCGTCRQLLYEYAKGCSVIMSIENGTLVKTNIENLLPYAYYNEPKLEKVINTMNRIRQRHNN